eukprot:Hpha_TRINITY_DN26281_c0_g1::TRINITY_DN26281_c0_g1_i1::g.184849::m.184849
MRLAALVAAGLVAADAAAWVPPTPAAVATQGLVDAAVRAGHRAVRLPDGDIVFNDASFNISHATGLVVGGGATTTLVFRIGVGVLIVNSSNVTLHSVAVDYSPLPYVHATVTAPVAAGDVNLTVKLGAGSITPELFVADFTPHDTWPPVTAYAGGTLDLRAYVGRWGMPPEFTPVAGTPGGYTLNCHASNACDPSISVGDVVVAPTRVGFTVALSYTADVTLRDVVIYAAGNMAVTEFQGSGNNRYINVSLVPRGASQPLASNADGFHSSGLRKGPRLW